MEKFNIPESNSLDSMEGVPFFHDEKRKERFFENVSNLKSALEKFLENQDGDLTKSQNQYTEFSVSLSSLSSRIGSPGLLKEERRLEISRVRLVIEMILKKIELYEKGDIDLHALNPGGLINHSLNNSLEVFWDTNEGDSVYNLYRIFLLLRAKSIDISGSSPRSAAETYEELDAEKYKNKIEKLKNLDDEGVYESSDGVSRNREEIKKEEYKLLRAFLEDIKDEDIMKLDFVAEIKKIIKKLESF